MKKYFEKIRNTRKEEFVRELEEKIEKNEKCFVVTANPEILMYGEKDMLVDKLLCDPNTEVVPDGIGLVIAGKRMGYEYAERIPGVELCQELLTYAAKNKRRLFLFGASSDVIRMLREKIEIEYDGIVLCGAVDGYVTEKDQVFDKIRQAEPDIVLVALGMPLQEKLIYKHLDKFSKGIFMGVGGSFDVLSGYKKRAPRFFVKLNLEWLYRIATEPKRLKRFWDNNIKFLFQIKNMK